MKARYRIIGIALLVGLLALIRYFEQELFYDPLIHFYKSDYLNDKIPHFLAGELLLNVFLRFSLNTMISLGIIYVAFFDKNIVKFSLLLYILLFIICFSAFSFLILTIENENFMALFYIRRFLIHPIFVIILLPAFYYYRLKNSGRYGSLRPRL
jgi:exosortase F-associated protein